MSLRAYLTLRNELLVALDEFRLSTAGRTRDALGNWIAKVGEEWPTDRGAEERRHLQLLVPLVEVFTDLCQWLEESAAAAASPERFLVAAKTKADVARSELAGSPNRFRDAAERYLSAVIAITQVTDITTVAQRLAAVPIPISGLDLPASHRFPAGTVAEPAQVAEHSLVIKVMLEIDGKPWINPQIVSPNLRYDLHAKVLPSAWPAESVALVLDHVTTLSSEHFDITSYRIDAPGDRETREAELQGHLVFKQPQSTLSEPTKIRLRASLLLQNGSMQSVPVIGHSELSVRVRDKNQVPSLARYRALDDDINGIVERIRTAMPGVEEDHLTDFTEGLAGLANFLGVVLQGATYRERDTKISEVDFQLRVLQHLRTLLGEDVKEGTRQAGGPTDIVYRSVTIELKVERETGDVAKLRSKYLGQPTQYASGAGAQLGICCILDVTEKTSPPGVPRNYVSLETPPIHGFEEGEKPPYPTKIAVVIVPGNLKRPSDYSR